jgi:hypothetical protein
VKEALVRSKAETVAQTEKLALTVLEKEQVSDEGAVRVTALQAELDAARKLANQQAHLLGDSKSSAMVRPVHALCEAGSESSCNARRRTHGDAIGKLCILRFEGTRVGGYRGVLRTGDGA